jgi:hypothetical protein
MLLFLISKHVQALQHTLQQTLAPWLRRQTLMILVVLGLVWLSSPFPAIAAIDDDHYDGNIFALYAGNGSLVPPQVSLAESFKGDRPTLLTFYLDDSRDCKQFSATISEIQAYYGRAVDIIPINVDSIPRHASFTPTEPGAYYQGKVPETILFNAAGQKVLDVVGKSRFEPFDDALRDLFDLLPRTQSVELKRRSLNEVNAELVK